MAKFLIQVFLAAARGVGKGAVLAIVRLFRR
jgi:hypothetical protein